jgi:hypothetical protein
MQCSPHRVPSLQFFTGIPRMAQRIFDHPRAQVLRFDPQDPVFIMHVHIPPDNTLQVIQVRTNVVNMLPVTEVGLKNKDVHI